MLEVATKLNYQRADSSKKIGLVVPRLGHPGYGEFMEFAHDAAAPHGYAVSIRSTGGNLHGELAAVEDLKKRNVLGIIILSPTSKAQQIKEWTKSFKGRPVVLVNARPHLAEPPANLVCITIDNDGGMESIVQFLVDRLGHVRVAYLSGPPASPSDIVRKASFEQAMAKRRLFDPRLVQGRSDSLVSFETGEELCSRLLGLADDRPTAIVAYSDMLAIGALRAAKDRGIAVPAQLSIIGIDNLGISSFVDPKLTTLDVRRLDQALEAVASCMDMIDDSTILGSSRSKEFTPLLLKRGSAARIEDGDNNS